MDCRHPLQGVPEMTQKLWLKGSIEYYLEDKRFGDGEGFL